MSRTIAGLVLCLLAFLVPACDKVPLTAPTGSTVVLNINTTTLPLNGTADITAIVVESGGTAPQNGTVVTFATTLGSIEPFEARTHNGRATAMFLAGTRSGTANVRAFSGDAETEAIEVIVGGAGANRIALRIESASADGTRTVLVATVFDEAGNPIPGVPVSFRATRGTVSPGVVPADNNGEARTTLTTSATSNVTAEAGGASAELAIAAPGSIALVVTTPAPPAAAEVGQPVTFTVTPSAEFFFSDVVVDFGDGSAPRSIGPVSAARTFTYVYNQRGTFTVIARASGANGSTSASTTVVVNERAPLQVAFAAPTPNPVSVAAGGIVNFTLNATLPTGSAIQRVEWDFGDGGTEVTTGLTITHRYQSVRTAVVTARVVTTDGRDGTASTTVNVVP